jgi:hypothetical protein
MVTPTQNVTNNVSTDPKPDVDLSGKSSLKSVNISVLNSIGVSQESIPHSKSTSTLKIYHQNIYDLRYKVNELIGRLDQKL